MNCQNCAAPMHWNAGSDVLQCRFCGSYRSIAMAAEFMDRVTPLGETLEQSCPKCCSPLERAAVDRMPASYCPNCRGLLFANDALALLIQERRANYRGADRTPQPLTPERLAGSVNCPACSRAMERHCYGGPGCQVIDCCSACSLVWLDSGELAAIEMSPGRRSSP